MVEDHRHCVVCGKPTAPEKFFCSPSCEALFRQGQRRAVRYRNMMIVLLVVIFALLFVTYMLRAGG
ncbi:MAG: DUF2116 family Zn-ribbon domain-containing protein [Candidatus Hadarchaeales archaeon]